MIVAPDFPSTESPYIGYSYGYPHKSAYRQLDPAVPLENLWAGEDRESLFLYFHLPFCEHRCGFCNLFTLANPQADWVGAYLTQLKTEAEQVCDSMSAAKFTRLAIGGGTPTFLDERQLQQLLDIAVNVCGVVPQDIPISCEASPATFTAEKAALLRGWGVDRLSLGVQSFDERESRALGRPQHTRDVLRAIELAHENAFPKLNLDLIYGAPGQSMDSWLHCVRTAVDHRPEEIYLYPLYVRELTGLGKTARQAGSERLSAYRNGRQLLLDAGYEQKSLRMFQWPGAGVDGPVYCCQSDGMVGFGCGARSYTRELHYSTEFAVERGGVRAILEAYLQRPPAAFRSAVHGFHLDAEDQRRRYAILGLLQVDGLSLSDYRRQFGSDLLDDLQQIQELVDHDLATFSLDRVCLTATGLELSDAIGPWLYSARVQSLMTECPIR